MYVFNIAFNYTSLQFYGSNQNNTVKTQYFDAVKLKYFVVTQPKGFAIFILREMSTFWLFFPIHDKCRLGKISWKFAALEKVVKKGTIQVFSPLDGEKQCHFNDELSSQGVIGRCSFAPSNCPPHPHMCL